jgi:Skp family chaperone for outer membrane proteins
MKQRDLTKWLCVVSAFVCIGGGQTNAHSSSHLAVVNTLEVLNQSVALQEIQKKFSESLNEDQSFVASIEKRLRESDQVMTQELQRLNHSSFSDSEKEIATNRLIANRHAYDREVAQLQEMLQKRKEYLDDVFGEAKGQIQKTVLLIIEGIAMRNNYDIVMNHTQVMYIAQNLEITTQVIQELNVKLPKLTINVEPIAQFKSRVESQSLIQEEVKHD